MELPAELSKSLLNRKLIALFVSVLDFNAVFLLTLVHPMLSKLLSNSSIFISADYDVTGNLFIVAQHRPVTEIFEGVGNTFSNDNIVENLFYFLWLLVRG